MPIVIVLVETIRTVVVATHLCKVVGVIKFVEER